MPKIVKTFRGNNNYASASDYFVNIVNAVSSAFSASAVRLDDGSNSNINEYYILTDSIGYPGFCIYFKISGVGGSSTSQSMAIMTTTSSNKPDFSDTNIISVTNSVPDSSVVKYSPATCVVFRDASNDTVSFSIHAGDSESSASNLNYWYSTPFKGFFAKDVNEDVLCGSGNVHIFQLRTKTNRLVIASDTTSPETYEGLNDCLHLTKMVNYLSPEYAEMKSAYVSVTRPKQKGAEFNKAYYADGARWGFAGCYVSDYNSGDRAKLLKPFSPWVKY